MQYFLGVDIGTSSAKAVAISNSGKVIEDLSTTYPMLYPETGWCEQDPNEIFEAIVQSVNAVVQKLKPAEPKLVAFSSAMHSLILLDEKGNPLTNCIIWADNRSEAIATQLRNSQLGMDFYNRTGVPMHSMSPLCKMQWFKENKPQLYQRAAKFVGIKEYVLFQLSKSFVVDTSLASATGLLNLHSLKWDNEVLNFLDISESKLPEVRSPHYFFHYNNTYKPLLLPTGVPVVLGASDGALANVGTGAVHPHQMAITIGTSGAARMMVLGAETDSAMRTFCYHVAGSKYIIGGATNNGGVVMQWLKEEVLAFDDDYEALFAEAKGIPPGCNGLIFLPYILGERAPIWNAGAKGVFFGLSIEHKRSHFIRAVMESVIFAIYSIAKVVLVKKSVTEIHASGGFARTPAWLQILADVCNIKVEVRENIDSSALGAVIIGAQALNFKVPFEERVAEVYYPHADNHLVYEKCIDKFEKLYFLLKSEMN